MSHLFESLTLRGVTLPNRIGVAPMCQYSSAEDGFANDWHLVHLGARAAGGAGLIITEAVAIDVRGRISPNDIGIWKDAHIAPLERITRFIKEQGAVPAIQLAHAGRKAGTTALSGEQGGWAPSAIPFSDDYRTPQELPVDEIKNIQNAFKDGALRALEAGFDVLEIHGAHGYLAHSFYSPITNKRTDEYGGSFENRTRFLLEIAEQMRAVMPDDKVLAVRLSTTDWLDDGWTIDDSVKLSIALKDAGVDLVDCSSGAIAPDVKMPIGAGYQVPLSEKIRHEAEVTTAAVGLINEPLQADEVIRNGRADIVLLGREMLRNPYWALNARRILHPGDKTIIPQQYLRAY
jgi:2,4-dienoyl-CoA reductase-like NADH-dependent reductase (Old Yellow Enzyme family)